MRQERQRLIEDAWISYVLLAVTIVFAAVMEWIRLYTKTSPQPLVFSGIALLAVRVLRDVAR